MLVRQPLKYLVIGLGRVIFLLLGMGQDGSGWVSYLWFRFVIGKFPLKMSNFSVFSKKTNSSGRVKKYLGQRWVGLLFTAGQS